MTCIRSETLNLPGNPPPPSYCSALGVIVRGKSAIKGKLQIFRKKTLLEERVDNI